MGQELIELSGASEVKMGTEAEFDREAAQLFRNMGLREVDTINYFQSSSRDSNKWKEGLRKPSRPRIRRFRAGDQLAQHSATVAEKCSSPAANVRQSTDSLKQSQLSGNRPHCHVFRTKSAPVNVKLAQCSSENTPTSNSLHCLSPPALEIRDMSKPASVLRVRSTYIPVPAQIPVQKGPVSPSIVGNHMQRTGTEVLYARKPSLKLLSVTSSAHTKVQPRSNNLERIVTKSMPLHIQRNSAGLVSNASRPSLADSYDRLEGYQGTEISSDQPPMKEVEFSLNEVAEESDFSQKSTSGSDVCETNQTSTLRHHSLSATFNCGASVRQPSLSVRNLQSASYSEDISFSTVDESSVRSCKAHTAEGVLLGDRMLRPDRTMMPDMNAVTTNTAQAVGIQLGVVTQTTRKNYEDECVMLLRPQAFHSTNSQCSSKNSRGEGFPVDNVNSCGTLVLQSKDHRVNDDIEDVGPVHSIEKLTPSSLKSDLDPSPKQAQSRITDNQLFFGEHRTMVKCRRNEIDVEDGKDFYGRC